MAKAPVSDLSDEQIAEKEASLALIIEEQKRDYDYLLKIYDRMRATENVLLTAGFAILAYLYYGAPVTIDETKNEIIQRLFVPEDDYGLVIYVIAAGFFLYGLFKLMLNVFGDNPWETAYETSKNNYTFYKLDTLEYIKERYDHCCKHNGPAYYKRKKSLVFLFYCITISAIILIVIKTLK